jgi:Na+-translocating ferredoxin:NAD+ oxidoreductase RnfG subunit
MGDIIKLSLVLLIVSAVAGLAIALTNQQTADRIAQQKLRAEEQALLEVLPDDVSISKKKAD